MALLVAFMAGGEAGGSGSKKKKPAKRARSSGSGQAREEADERDDSQLGGSKQGKWARDMPRRGFKVERQVSMPSQNREKYGLHHIARRGMTFWFEPLEGYSETCVIKFYQNMVVELDVPVARRCIKAKMGNKLVIITPNSISQYLHYHRPDTNDVTYPREDDVSQDSAAMRDALYSDPSKFNGVWVPGCFKEDCRFINKVLCANLYPRGSEHKPGFRGAELVYAFMSQHHVIDVAAFIFHQICSFQLDAQDSVRMPFPCMITTLVKKAGVLSPVYAKMAKLTPGPLTLTSWNKSEAQLRKQKGKGDEDELLEEPEPKAKQETWVRKIWKMCAHLVKENKKMKKKRKEDRKLIARQAHKIDWMHERHPEAASYVPPPDEDSGESEQDEIEEEDERANAATFMQGFQDATAGHAGASGDGGDPGFDPGVGPGGDTQWW